MRKIGSITLCVSILTLILVLSTLVVVAGNANVSMVSESKSENPSKSLTSHDPIHIDGNDDFASQASSEGWAGNGTESNPYIIENYDIDASKVSGGWSGAGIKIENTEMCCIIRNCVIHDGGWYYDGIHFYNVTNGKIDNVTSYNNYRGIRLFSSSNNTITNCDVYNNHYDGIRLLSSSDNTITNCNVYKNSWSGILLYSFSNNNQITNCNVYNNDEGIYLQYHSNNNNITDCNTYDNTNGIYLDGSSNNNITNCYIYDNSYGIYLKFSSNNNITSCYVYDNSRGVYLESSSNNSISNCTVYNNSDGIYLQSHSNNNNITDCYAYDNTNGIYLYDSANNNIVNCYVYNNSYYGIYLSSSSNNKLTGNTFTNNGLIIWGDSLYYYIHTIDTTNLVNGRMLYYFLNQSNLYVDNWMVGELILVNCTNSTIKNINVFNTDVSIELAFSVNLTITNCTAHSNDGDGILLVSSSYNNITNCDVYNNSGDGIYLYESSNNNILNCDVYNNSVSGDEGSHGIRLFSSSNNQITDSEVYNNSDGIYLWYSSDNIITNCYVYDNSGGICLGSSSNNNITNCYVYDNSYGIYLKFSSNNKLRYNILENNIYNFGVNAYNLVEGAIYRTGDISQFYQDVDISNTINGKPIYYIIEQNNLTFDKTMNIGYLGLISCNKIIVENVTFTDNAQGLLLAYTSHSTIINSTFTNNYRGIRSYYSSENNITNCLYYNNLHDGIFLEFSSNNNITNCVVYNSSYYDIYEDYGHGIFLFGSSNNEITSSTFHGGYFGIGVSSSSYNTIVNCAIYNNEYGIGLDDWSPDNQIIGCTISNNSQGISAIASVNIVSNHIHNNRGRGIFMGYSASGKENSVTHDVNILNNIILSNDGEGIYVYNYANSYGYACIHNINIFNNTIASNKCDGIYLKVYAIAWGVPRPASSIYDVTIQNNTLLSNDGCGVYLFSDSYNYYSYIYNVNMSHNIISSNHKAGIETYAKTHYPGVDFDIVVWSDNIYENSRGIAVSGEERVNISYCSIAYNTEEGIYIVSAKNNTAHFNDIYDNMVGMGVSAATVNAENNYWGNSSGPYHSTVNPNGSGNSVGGIGTDLDFMPYLTESVGVINQRPTAELFADKTSVFQNENINFDANGSTDDTKVERYFFDLDDGTNTGWVTTPTTTHKYSTAGTYDATVVVMDEYGVKSNNTAKVTISVKQNNLPVIIITYPSSGATVRGTITVYGTSSDSDGAVQSVEVSIDDNTFASNKLTMSGTTSWSASWNTTQYIDGNHTVYARAYDGIDYSDVKSVTVTVNQIYVNQAPTVTTSSPSDDETVSGTITVSGSASDPDGVVTVVQIRIDGGSWETASGTTSWSYSWNTTKVSEGSHTISVRSFDGTNYSSIDSVNVNIKNEGEDEEEDETSAKLFDIPWLYILIPIVIIIILAVVGIGIKRKRRKVALPPQPLS